MYSDPQFYWSTWTCYVVYAPQDMPSNFKYYFNIFKIEKIKIAPNQIFITKITFQIFKNKKKIKNFKTKNVILNHFIFYVLFRNKNLKNAIWENFPFLN